MAYSDFNYRRSRANIDLNSYVHNIKYFQEKCRPTKVMAVLKADGYGHGAFRLAKAAVENGIEYLAVAFLEEAIELRKCGIDCPILVLNYFEPKYVGHFLEHDLTATIYSEHQFEQLRHNLGGDKLKSHVILDTGMARLGHKEIQTAKLIDRMVSDSKIHLEGIYTHFSSADDIDMSYTELQYRRFKDIVSYVKDKVEFIHIANSAGALNFDAEMFDFIRLGIASYGMNPRNEERQDFLEPVLSWETTISFVKKIQKGEPVSYGRTFIAPDKMKVATIPIGYADGYNRLLSNKGQVLVKGERCSILGRVCMDQFVVDVSHITDVEEGERVVLLGKMGSEEISSEEIADLIGTINYEITCNISKRIPRRYLEI